ncbi:MAG: sigma 54-dependent Fis family transcriptional regulator [Archangiaceae bacterium]|nr:sigma 54-dependent Fis family transcriptional regulator [Archangiaceae bacterium]
MNTAATEDLGGSGSQGPVAPVRIEVAGGAGAGRFITLESGTVFVGKHQSCDLVVDDASVSRRHLSVELLAGAVQVRDLGSRNGTVYLGARIQDARVPIGGSLKVGRVTLRFAPVVERAAPAPRDGFHGLIGSAVGMRRVFDALERVARESMAVLLQGESGTGKDSLARALHQASPRQAQPFVVFDCAAVAPQLLEAELFGHARGAFTGASAARAGPLELALGGTLFLDEVAELPKALQPRLLRVLDSGEFKRVGDNAVRRFSGRVVAATRTDLQAEVKAGNFREDLFFRLSSVVVKVPPLRERREDIPLLVERFAGEQVLSPSTLAAMQCDPWPGNVRELKNAVARVLALGTLGDEPAGAPGQDTDASFHAAREKLMDSFERDYLAVVLERHGGNISAAARGCGLSRRQFHRLLDKHALGRVDA